MKRVVVILVALLLLSLIAQSLTAAPKISAQTQTNGFTVLNAVWGTQSNTMAPKLGAQDVPLTVTLQYVFANTATGGVQASLSLPAGLSGYDGSSTTLGSAPGNYPPGSTLDVTFYVNIDPNATLGQYTIPMNVSWSAAGYSYVLNQHLPIAISLQGTPQLDFSLAQSPLIPGETNNITVVLSNDGNGNASQISTALSGPPQLVSVLAQFPYIPTLTPGTNVSEVVELYVPASAAGSSLSLTFSTQYVDAYGNSEASVQALGLYVENIESSISAVSLTVQPTTLAPGEVNNLTVTLTDNSTYRISEITATVSAAQSEVSVVSQIPTVAYLSPGSSVNSSLSLYVTQSASGSPVTLNFAVSYVDAYGSSKSVSMSSGLYVESIQPTISPISITVSPTTLLEGQVNNMTVTASNSGDSTINTLSLSFAFQGGQATWLEPDLVQEATLQPGQNITIDGQVYDSTGGATSTALQVTIQYYEGTAAISHQEVRSIGILSRGLINMSLVNYALIPTPITPGTIFSITGTLNNEGTIPASGAVVTAEPLTGFKIYGASSTFIGSMPLDAPSTFTITLLVSNATTPGKYNLPVQVTYVNNLRTISSRTINIPITVVASTSGHTGILGSHKKAPFILYGKMNLNLIKFVIIGALASFGGFLLGFLFEYRRKRRA